VAVVQYPKHAETGVAVVQYAKHVETGVAVMQVERQQARPSGSSQKPASTSWLPQPCLRSSESTWPQWLCSSRLWALTTWWALTSWTDRPLLPC